MRIFYQAYPAPIKCRLPHRRAVHLQHQPVMDHLHHIALLLLAQRAAVGNGVPFFQTAAAAGGGRMLGDKYGWPRIGVCLPSFIGSAGASRWRIKSAACWSMISGPLSRQYCRSLTPSRKRERNVERARRANNRSCSTIRTPTSPSAESVFPAAPRRPASSRRHQAPGSTQRSPSPAALSPQFRRRRPISPAGQRARRIRRRSGTCRWSSSGHSPDGTEWAR